MIYKIRSVKKGGYLDSNVGGYPDNYIPTHIYYSDSSYHYWIIYGKEYGGYGLLSWGLRGYLDCPYGKHQPYVNTRDINLN